MLRCWTVYIFEEITITVLLTHLITSRNLTEHEVDENSEKDPDVSQTSRMEVQNH